MFLTTGRAEWIWYTDRLREPRPLAFVATRDFELSKAPEKARARMFVDRTHVLYVNGALAGSGSQRPGDPLAVYEVAPLLKAGVNRVAIAAASPTGIGGILFSLEIFMAGRDAVVSDGRWRVDPSAEAIRSGARYRPVVWGRPPQYPWGYPRMPEPRELGGLGLPDEHVEGFPGGRALGVGPVVAGEGDDLLVSGDGRLQVVKTSILNPRDEETSGKVAGSDLEGFGAEDESHVVAFLGGRQAGAAVVEVRLAGRI
jgi:hypothetical protein